MKDIAIFGAGGLGKEVATLISQINEKEPIWNFVGFYDDGKPIGEEISHWGKVLGGIEELNKVEKPLAIVVAVGNPKIHVKSIYDRIVNKNIEFPNLIHPNFVVTDKDTFSIGRGNIIQGGCVATCDVEIGSFNVFNGYVVMGHNVTIGDYNTIMPDIRISGEVTIGDNNLIGVGSIILQQIKIGNNVHLGAGAVLMTKPKDGCTYIGNPAKLLKY